MWELASLALGAVLVRAVIDVAYRMPSKSNEEGGGERKCSGIPLPSDIANYHATSWSWIRSLSHSLSLLYSLHFFFSNKLTWAKRIYKFFLNNSGILDCHTLTSLNFSSQYHQKDFWLPGLSLRSSSSIRECFLEIGSCNCSWTLYALFHPMKCRARTLPSSVVLAPFLLPYLS